MSGWWVLPSDHNYIPPEEFIHFLQCKPVYIGFGSMKGNPEFCSKLSTLAIKGLYLAETRGLLLGGWAGLTRESLDRSTSEGQKLYEWAQVNVFEIDACPHEWLFPQCAAVVHHGGAGTLAAGALAEGINDVITNQSFINAAREMSSKVQQEDGAKNTIDFIDKMAVSYI
jgi:sterol 3beta-glucosyltransferase